MAMENSESESLSIDSFSHSWLINPGPFEISGSCSSVRSSIDEGPSSFIEMDPRLPASKRFSLGLQSSTSNFHFPNYSSPVPLLHADDLFYNGQILPRSAPQFKNLETGRDHFDVGSDVNLTASTREEVASKGRCPSLKRCRTISKSVFNKYLSCCLQPFIYRRGPSSKVAENWMASPETIVRSGA